MNSNVRSWSQMIDAARARGDSPARQVLIAEAEKVLALPLLRRVYRYEDLGQHRSWRDGRAVPLEPEIQEYFALSMSDHGATWTLAGELPTLAAAYRLTGETAYRNRVIAQLEEAVTWSPLQRPGWTCYQRGARKPADGKTGSWLATGSGVRAIATALDILPTADVSSELRSAAAALFEREIAEILDDWKSKRQWFVQHHNVLTNQWVLPTEGLVRACLAAGRDKHREAYELGVSNMLESIDAHGSAGEFEEGLHYANFTVLSMFHAAHAMAVVGDFRAIERPFLRRFALWAVHHLMPGRLGVNAFDAFSAAAIPRDHQGMREVLSAAATFMGDSAANWALANQFDSASPDAVGLGAATNEQIAPPPLFAQYERATRVNWRSSWRDDATGFWVRGGHSTDQHDHHDRGHVTFILHGRPVLIETGTPAYHHPDLSSLFSTGAGHNVLQIGMESPGENARSTAPRGWQKRSVVAPITTARLDDSGGKVSVDISAGYDGLARWGREIEWNVDSLKIEDAVTLADGAKDVLLFRWHLGVPTARVEGDGREFVVTCEHGVIRITANEPIQITQEPRENHSLVLRGWDDPLPYPRHTCLMVRTQSPVNELHIATAVSRS